MDNIFDLPVKDGGSTPLQTARALLDYVKDRPNSKVIAIVVDEGDSSITMGWSHMSSAEMSLMLRFANFKWEKTTFEEMRD